MQHSFARRQAGMVACALLLGTLTSAPADAGGTPQGSGFVYQGLLKQGGAPADGVFDVEFRLFDVPSGGTALGTVALPAQTITEGMLTVAIDFGPGAFDGSERWLEIQVEGTTLVPRQKLAAAPYALHALSAGAISIMNFPTGGNWNLASSLNVDAGTLHVAPSTNRVGINTSSPSATLSVAGDTKLNGNVGIGIAAPPAGPAGTAALVLEHSFQSYIELGHQFGARMQLAADGSGNVIRAVSSHGLTLQTAGQNRLFIANGGNVGIGTTAPAHLLEARGLAPNFGGAIHGVQTGGHANGAGTMGLSEIANGNGVIGIAHLDDGVVGGSFPTAVWGITDGIDGAALFAEANHLTGVNYGVRAQINSPNGFAGYFTGPVGARSYFGTRVGIGTPSPTQMLHVNGNLNVSGWIGTDTNAAVEIRATGGVGIGTTTPTAGLEVNKGATNDTALRVTSSGLGWGSGIRFANTAVPNGREYGMFADPNGIFHFSDNVAGATRMAIDPTGKVGLGTTAPSFQLHLSSDSAAKPGTNTWTNPSDRRLKKDIKPLESSLDRLLQLRGVTFRWIDPASQGGRTGIETGLIAQEVEPVFPEWVGTNADGYKTLTIGGFEALTAEALRELRAEKDAELAELRAANEELRRDVSELRRLVQDLLNAKSR